MNAVNTPPIINSMARTHSYALNSHCASGEDNTFFTLFIPIIIPLSSLFGYYYWYYGIKVLPVGLEPTRLSAENFKSSVAAITPREQVYCIFAIEGAPAVPGLFLVLLVRLELTRPCGHRILNPARLPLRHRSMFSRGFYSAPAVSSVYYIKG